MNILHKIWHSCTIFCRVLKCDTIFYEGFEEVLKCNNNSQRNFLTFTKFQKKSTMFHSVPCSIMSKTVVQISSRRRKAPQPESAVHRKVPQSPPRYEVALHGSKRFSHEAEVYFKVHKIPQHVLKVRKSPQSFFTKKTHRKCSGRPQEGDETLSKVLQDYPRFYALLVIF